MTLREYSKQFFPKFLRTAIGHQRQEPLVFENSHTFTAIRGIQAGREYYVTMIPLRIFPQIFHSELPDLAPNLRAQRVLNRTRVPEMARYITDNPRGYIFSALTASVDGKIRFEPLGEAPHSRSVGRLIIPMTARCLVNDGQHRRAAVELALKERPELGEETLSVIIFADAGLKRSQQMFADLNRNVVRPAPSLNILYDHRDPMAQLAWRVVARVPVFKSLIETERSSVPGRTNKLFTLSGVFRATCFLLGRSKRQTPQKGDEELASEYWELVSRQIPDWGRAAENKVECAQLRKDYIHAHGVALEALGLAGASLLAENQQGWKATLTRLKKIDWSRENSAVWEGVALVGGKVSKSHVHLGRTADKLKHVLGISLPMTSENVTQGGRNSQRSA